MITHPVTRIHLFTCLKFLRQRRGEFEFLSKKLAMKTRLIIYYLVAFFVLCLLIWKTGDGFYVVPAYAVLSAIVIGVRKNLLTRLEA